MALWGTTARRRWTLPASIVLLVVVAVAVVLLARGGSGPAPTATGPSIRLTDAEGIERGAVVRVDGARAGEVADVLPAIDGRGRSSVVVRLRLDRALGALPADTTATVGGRTLLGPREIDLTRGRSTRPLGAGGRIALARADATPDPTVAALDPGARDALHRTDGELVTALAGRGRQLGDAATQLAPMTERLAPVMAKLSDPRTRLGPAIASLARTAAEVAPVAGVQGRLLRHLDATLAALAPVVRPAVGDALREGTRLQATAQRDLPRLRSSSAATRRLLAELGPGLRAVRNAAPTIEHGLDRAAGTAARLPDADTRLRDTLASLGQLGDDPLVARSFDAQTSGLRAAGSILAQQAPGQVTCNTWTLLARNLASQLSEGNRYGTWARALLVLAPGQTLPAASPSRRLNADPYPNEAQPGARRECEAGNEPYAPGGRTGHPAGNQGTHTAGQPGRGR